MFQSLKFFSNKIALIDSNNKKITYKKLVEDSEFIKKNLNKKFIN